MPHGRAEDVGHEQPVTAGSEAIMSHPTMIEYKYDIRKPTARVSACWPSGKKPAIEALTPASPDSLPPLGDGRRRAVLALPVRRSWGGCCACAPQAGCTGRLGDVGKGRLAAPSARAA
jgi:hypothetical protein